MSFGEKDIRMDIFNIGFGMAITIMPGMYLVLLLKKYSQRFSIITAILYYATFLLIWNLGVMN